MNKIIFPTDFSECAGNAQRIAVQMAKKFDASLTVVHVVPDTIFKWESVEHMTETINMLPVDSSNVHVKTVHTGLEQLTAKLKELKEQILLEGVNVSTELLFGEPHTELLEYVKAEKPGLVIMGTNGASGLREEFIGSKTQWLNRYADCAVISVRYADENPLEIKNVVYASDFKEAGANNNIDQIGIFARSFGAKIHLLFINTPHQFEESMSCYDRIEAAAQKHNLENFDIHIYNHFTAEDGIISFINKFDTDLISISNHGHSGIKRWTEFRTTETLINHSRIPVLSMNIE